MSVLKRVGLAALIVWMILITVAVLRILTLTEHTCSYAYIGAKYGPPHPKTSDWERLWWCPASGLWPYAG